MRTEEFDYNVESRIVPDDPVELRGKSREDGKMVVLDRSTDKITHTVFSTICQYFRPGDLLVLNDSYVLANVLWFRYGDETTHVGLCGHEPDGTTIVDVFGWPMAAPALILTSKNNDRLTCTLLEALPDQLLESEIRALRPGYADAGRVRAASRRHNRPEPDALEIRTPCLSLRVRQYTRIV